MELKTNGFNRIVILTKKYAIKIPHVWKWKNFLFGIVDNMTERDVYARTVSDKGMTICCPVVFSFPGGWLNIMKRAQPMSQEECDKHHDTLVDLAKEYNIRCEFKPCSWGWLAGTIVVVDYGWCNS